MGRVPDTPDNEHTNWVLCLTHNGLEYTQKAVTTILNQDIGNTRIMVIENASTDGTLQWLWDLYPKVIAIPRNLGVAESWNLGLDFLFSQGAKRILVVNNDIQLRAPTYRLLDTDGGEFVTAVGDDDLYRVNQWSVDNFDHDKHRPHPDFSCFLIRKECWDKVGRFDENFERAYGEDCDYHCRMYESGVGAVCIDVPFYHVASGTQKTNPGEREVINQKADGNRAYFYSKWGFEIGSEEYEGFFKKEE